LGSRTFGSTTRWEADPVSNELIETQRVNRQEMFSALIYSRSSAARIRNWEIPAALVSTLSQQLQEKHSIKIAQCPVSMADVSEVEGTARLNKYALTFNVLSAYHKKKPTQFFDTFAEPAVITNP